jgi:hypothetical protein
MVHFLKFPLPPPQDLLHLSLFTGLVSPLRLARLAETRIMLIHGVTLTVSTTNNLAYFSTLSNVMDGPFPHLSLFHVTTSLAALTWQRRRTDGG